jgi:hypothetical protein
MLENPAVLGGNSPPQPFALGPACPEVNTSDGAPSALSLEAAFSDIILLYATRDPM